MGLWGGVLWCCRKFRINVDLIFGFDQRSTLNAWQARASRVCARAHARLTFTPARLPCLPCLCIGLPACLPVYVSAWVFCLCMCAVWCVRAHTPTPAAAQVLEESTTLGFLYSVRASDAAGPSHAAAQR
jgi:hypothetical protein